MPARTPKLVVAVLVLVLLPVAALFCLYQALFDVWMTAYLPAHAADWRHIFYFRLVVVAAFGLLWVRAGIWLAELLRHRNTTVPLDESK